MELNPRMHGIIAMLKNTMQELKNTNSEHECVIEKILMDKKFWDKLWCPNVDDNDYVDIEDKLPRRLCTKTNCMASH